MALTASELCSLRAAPWIVDEVAYQPPPCFLSIGCALVDSFLCWPSLFAPLISSGRHCRPGSPRDVD